MSHFGVLSYKGAGHINPMIALSRHLVARGHRVTMIHTAELEALVRGSGLEFCSLGSAPSRFKPTGVKKGRWPMVRDILAVWNGVDRIGRDMEFFLKEASRVLMTLGLDALLMDEISLAGPTLAESFHLPYFVLSTSVPHTFGWSGSASIARETTWLDRLRDAILEVSIFRMRGPVCRRLNKLREARGLSAIGRVQDRYPELAHITQLPSCLDLPRSTLPDRFHYAGPLIDENGRASMHFPWEQLDGRRIVYASLGTSRSTDLEILRRIAEACSLLDLQLVLSLGGRHDPACLGGLPGRPVVVRDLPQLEVLKRADIVITHGGLNTSLETLMQGKPMIVIPMRFDQPAVAARLEWHGVALVLSAKSCSSLEIREALMKILEDVRFRANAANMREAMRSTCGLRHAGDIIEEALQRHAGGGKRASERLRSGLAMTKK